ncbi:hypothetical protein G9A89_022079 [Geosiphon pyriformis]|nr:hypothetical protein G9A89_022079 [Geosiphon pyriformis]
MLFLDPAFAAKIRTRNTHIKLAYIQQCLTVCEQDNCARNRTINVNINEAILGDKQMLKNKTNVTKKVGGSRIRHHSHTIVQTTIFDKISNRNKPDRNWTFGVKLLLSAKGVLSEAHAIMI